MRACFDVRGAPVIALVTCVFTAPRCVSLPAQWRRRGARPVDPGAVRHERRICPCSTAQPQPVLMRHVCLLAAGAAPRPFRRVAHVASEVSAFGEVTSRISSYLRVRPAWPSSRRDGDGDGDGDGDERGAQRARPRHNLITVVCSVCLR